MDEFKKICNVLIEQVKLLKLTQINFDDLPEKEYESLLEEYDKECGRNDRENLKEFKLLDGNIVKEGDFLYNIESLAIYKVIKTGLSPYLTFKYVRLTDWDGISLDRPASPFDMRIGSAYYRKLKLQDEVREELINKLLD